MNLKDRIIKRLLNIGKKHRVLIYPTLAVVAVVSAISQMVIWGKGNGKRFVASIMIVAMLITQSLFLSSDAANVGGGDDNYASPSDSSLEENDMASFEQGEPNELTGVGSGNMDGMLLGAPEEPKPTQINVVFVYVTQAGHRILSAAEPIDVDVNGNFVIPIPSEADRISKFFTEDSSYFEVTDCYTDSQCQNPITGSELVYADDAPEVAGGTVHIYYKIRRMKHEIDYVDTDDTVIAAKITDLSAYTVPGQTFVEYDHSVDLASAINAYKTGYTYAGISYNHTSYAAGSNIHISAAGVFKFVAQWTPQTIDLSVTGRPADLSTEINNSIQVDNAETITIPYTYGNELVLPSSTMNNNLSSEAYYISDWEINGNLYPAGSTVSAETALTFVQGTANVSDAVNIEQKYPIKAVWSYKNIVLTSDNTMLSVGDSAGDGATLTAKYGDTFSVMLGAKYKLDNMDSTGFSYTISGDDNTLLNSYGILQSGISDSNGNQGIQFVSLQGVKEVPTTTLQIDVVITDSHNSSILQVCPITLNLQPKELSLDAATIKTSDGQRAPSKEYDGNTHIDVKPIADLVGIINEDDVSVSFDQSANFDSAVVGSDKAVILTGISLNGAMNHRYCIPDTMTIENIGTIEAKALNLVMSLMNGETDTIKFGMATPKYKLDLDAVSIANLTPEDKAVYDSYVLSDNTTEFVRQYVGFTGWSTPRDLYSVSKTYTVVPLISSTDKNYTASASNLSMDFTVTRDDGTNEYKLLGDKINNYYKELHILPLAETTEYDLIRRVTDGQDIAEGTSEEVVNAMDWKTSLSIEDMVDGTIRFQMRSSTTGAITGIVTLSNMNIDSKGPVIEKMSASPKNLINSFNFGSYYHSQNSVEFVTMKIYYTSVDSPCTKLHYYFVDADGNASGETLVDFVENPSEGNFVATFTVGTANRGQLVVYAENLATNTSVKSRIRMDVVDKLIETNDYYEWMVENNIADAQITVSDKNGITANSNIWYNELQYLVAAKDDESGVNSIVWNVTTPNGILTPSPSEEVWSIGKNLTYNFKYAITEASMPAGEYIVSATFRDNAGNSFETDSVGPYLVDCIKPVIAIDSIANQTVYQSGIDFHFTVTEGDDESGIRKVTLYKIEDGNKIEIKAWTPADEPMKRRLRREDYRIVNAGTYMLEAEDVAGNISFEERTFTKLSTTVPDMPAISIDGNIGNNGWYKGMDVPRATIDCQIQTFDNVPVTTKYKVITANSSVQSTIDAGHATESFVVNEQGVVTVNAWSISESGIQSAVASKEIKIDTEKPTIEIVKVFKNVDGQLSVNFRVKDSVSGVNPSKITLNGNMLTVASEGNAYIGSFVVTNGGTYEILAEDMAGNIADPIEFLPLRMNVAPATDITSETAHVEADIQVGTYDVNECYIAYRKAGEANYRTALFNKTTNGNKINLSCDFRDLTPNTVYEYKVYASNEKAEVCVEESKFRTLTDEATGGVYGTVTYASSILSKDYPVYVSLYDANTIVASKKLSTKEETEFAFANIPDGSYRVVATNGMLTETASVTLLNGGVIYPTTYANDGGVNLVLNGLNTRVIIEDDSISLTADDLESIFDNSVYKGILTDADIAALRNNGSVTINLYAKYLDVEDLSADEAHTFKLNMAENAVIERYISLRIEKEVRDVSGNYINETPVEIQELYNPITISFPLGSLAGQQIYVASAHENSGNYSYMNWTTSPEAVITRDYVTITTRFFSVYALYRIVPSDVTYNVTWKDGDGQVMKTEVVKEGTAATPPDKTPTKSPTENYTYKFNGWDIDYSNITRDCVILAKFEAVAIEKKPSDTTENPPVDLPQDSTEAPPAEVVEPDTSPKSYTYLGSAESPKTGDETPIVFLLVLMSACVVGMLVCHKKNKQ